ncbi:hypothetical protein GCM10018954_011790 [Kutzneria kofuensis]
MTTHPVAPVPERLFEDPEAEKRWRARFTARRVSLPEWALHAPERSLYVSNASGVWEVYAWNRATDEHRQVTDRPNGTMHATLSPDGEQIWWFNDTDGDEFGSWVVEPYAGGEARPALEGVHDGYPAGLEVGSTRIAVGASTDDGTTIWVTRDGKPEVIYVNENDGGVASLSRDERLLAISHSEHGDSRHPALRVLKAADGAVVAEKWDGKGKGLDGIAFSPVAGDPRLLVLHERRGKEELLIWDVEADTETEIHIDLPGELAADWYTDGQALLIVHSHRSRTTLHRYDIATGELSTLDTPRGTIGGAGARPDGAVEYSWSSAEHPSAVRVLSAEGDRVLLQPPATGRRPRSRWRMSSSATCMR